MLKAKKQGSGKPITRTINTILLTYKFVFLYRETVNYERTIILC
jgi:hypothetical protein